jgi:hypothetical protein
LTEHEKRIEEIECRLGNATAGEWKAAWTTVQDEKGMYTCSAVGPEHGPYFDENNAIAAVDGDTIFIAYAIEDIRYLLAKVYELDDAIKEMVKYQYD